MGKANYTINELYIMGIKQLIHLGLHYFLYFYLSRACQPLWILFSIFLMVQAVEKLPPFFYINTQ